MTIDEAIEILTKTYPSFEQNRGEHFKNAYKLGIEALKQIKVLSKLPYYTPMLGETKE